LKHGPNELVGDDTALVFLATVDRRNPDSLQRYTRVLQLLEDMVKQRASIIAVANAGDQAVEALTPYTIAIDEAAEPELLFSEVVPLQLLSYVMAVNQGIDVDRPRNLSKAVLID
jgi:glucosamine--fructose-6-phosphate aminotransferase (isomerizing)